MGRSIPTGSPPSPAPGFAAVPVAGPEARATNRRAGRPGRRGDDARPGPRGPGRARGGARGLTYIMVLILLMVMGISTAVAAPVWHTEIRRDREEELLFRLGEYRRAIAWYRAEVGRPPRELKDLLEDRSRFTVRRYLRRLYPDPITGRDDWKLDYLTDRTGAILGIADIHSSSEREPLRQIRGKRTYKDW